MRRIVSDSFIVVRMEEVLFKTAALQKRVIKVE